MTTAVAKGDLSRKIMVDARGEILALKDTINTMVDQLSSFASEVTRVAREVGTEGRLGGQADVYGVAGTWKDLTESVNSMASNLTNQVRNIARVTTAVATGDLSRKITVDVRGEMLELKNTINTMVDQLNSFASEVTRVAREVGTEGRLGGQAEVRGVAGTWKDLTDNVNMMAANLTTQVRGIAKVVTAVAMGDLKRKLVLETKGEIAELADTINAMIDTLAVFADQVTSVAREVGIEGKLGGQARVPGAAGIWRDLTDNVNQLAANLTTQVRAIAEVATAVTKGDLTRSVTVEALGEVAALKDNINEMISNLAETTRKNTDQDWLKTNLAKFTRMVQGQRDLLAVAKLLLSELTPLVGAQRSTFYISEAAETATMLKFMAGYAYDERDELPKEFRVGQGLIGECARQKQRILVKDVPGDYIKIASSLGGTTPLSIVVLPVLFEGEVKAVVELASIHQLSEIHLAFLEQLTESMGIVLNTIAATMRTEQLLTQSQALAEELQKTNAELQEKAKLLAEQNTEVEAKSREIELARQALEEKAEQLALTSKYKSEFLANMSHELRTPLNNLLILARMLAENVEGNLSPKQVKSAETIHSSGTDLLSLINDILDLSKIESGKMDVDIGNVRFSELEDYCQRTFRHVAEGKGLEFTIEVDQQVSSELIRTDVKRLQQVLKNLLSNALKFTEAGAVRLQMRRALSGWTHTHPVLTRAKSVIAFSVTDTGIGILQEKQRIIFEAFQQADGTTSRKYGGTGLGLSISRELARLLGGEIHLQSIVGKGSTFTLFLPQLYSAPVSRAEWQPEPPVQVAQPETGRDLTLAAAPIALAGDLAEEDLVIEDDRNQVRPEDQVLLAVEDDATFARILIDLAHARGLKALVALRGSTAMSLAREFKPGAITLDVRLPDMTGWTLLDRLKHDPATRHIPVHVISAHENNKRGYALGAASCLDKPVSKDAVEEAFDIVQHSMEGGIRRVLLTASEGAVIEQVSQVIGGTDLEIHSADAADALASFDREHWDAIVIDVDLRGTAPFDLVEAIQTRFGSRVPPVMLFGARSLPEPQAALLHRLGRNSAVRYAPSFDRLLAETVNLLHRSEGGLSEEQRKTLEVVRQGDTLLDGKTVLVVDDDLRNIFALTSLLEHKNLKVLHAENGRAGIEVLQATPNVDLVLMDIMMPGMDGYETTRAIRRMPEFAALPIIALTAKAMKGDRDKCLEAGASDYVAKPVDVEQLLSAMRVWISRHYEEPTHATFVPHRPQEEDLVMEDDRNSIAPGDPVLLMAEDDAAFARIMVDIAHECNLKALVALRGSTAISLAREFKPGAITLDIRLPDMTGWTLLDRLKHDPATRPIPVHVISAHENARRGYALGATSCTGKPISKEALESVFGIIQGSMERRVKRLLIASAETGQRAALRDVLGGADIEILEAESRDCLADLASKHNPDGVVIDLDRMGENPLELLEALQTGGAPLPPPILLYAARELNEAETKELRRVVRNGLVRHACSVERLLDDTISVLQRTENDFSAEQRSMLEAVRLTDPMLAGRTILVVDDDLRNIFALTSLLEHHHLQVLYAENGRAGIETLTNHPEIDLVLMDIMMPGMDGYETIRTIRGMTEFQSLPMIAVTAKAMKGDRDKCLQAGASDYVAKPVDVEHLLSVMRVWIARKDEMNADLA